MARNKSPQVSGNWIAHPDESKRLLCRAPVNAMSLFAEHILATGDDDGNVKVCDSL